MSLAVAEQYPGTLAQAGFTLGVEEELFLVDPVSFTPVACEAVLAGGRFSRGVITGELCDGVVELASPVSEGSSGAAVSVAGMRREVLGRSGLALLGVGVHPAAAFGDVRHRRSP